MRVMMTTFTAPTHLNAMVPLAWALRTAGHDVRVVGAPALARHTTAAGLTAVAVGTDVDLPLPSTRETVQNPFGNIDFERFYDREVAVDELLAMFGIVVPKLLAPINEPLIDGLVGFAESWRPDLVVWEPMTWAGALAARACGARHARLQWGPDVLGRAVVSLDERLARMPQAHHDDPLREWLRWAADLAGVAWDPALVLGHWTMEVEPPRFRLDTGLDVVSVGYIPYNGPSAVPDWLRAEPRRPRVCVTLGMSSRDQPGVAPTDVVAVVHALAALDVEIVATLSAQQQAAAGPLPANVRAVDFVPLDALLPSCRAVVHHGGAGTWSTALRHGVPQIVLGHTWDAVLKARMIERAGAGRRLPPDAEETRVRDAVACVLREPGYAAQAAVVRAEVLAQPTPAQAVAGIERRMAAAGVR